MKFINKSCESPLVTYPNKELKGEVQDLGVGVW